MTSDVRPFLDEAPWLRRSVDASHLELLIFLAWLGTAMWQLGYYDGLGRCVT